MLRGLDIHKAAEAEKNTLGHSQANSEYSCYPYNRFVQSVSNFMGKPKKLGDGGHGIYRQGRECDRCNYRPVSPLPVVLNVTELSILAVISRYIIRNGFISQNQHGFQCKIVSDRVLDGMTQIMGRGNR